MFLNGSTADGDVGEFPVGPDFFEQAKKTGRINFDSLAYVVQIENTGTRTVTPHKQGLRHLRFERGKGRCSPSLASFVHGIQVEPQRRGRQDRD